MGDQLPLIPPPNMTELERLFEDRRTAFILRHQESLNAWEKAAKRDVTLQAESARRSIGQLFRWAATRLGMRS